MNLFRRKDASSYEVPTMPPELDDYYQAEKRQRVAVTWLLGFATLAITIAVAFGLFVSARWLVQKVRKEPAAKQPETTQDAPAPDKIGQAAPVQPSDLSVPALESSVSAGSNTQRPQNNSGPQTSSTVTNLPNTGPIESLAVFMVATTAGMFAYRLASRRR